MSSPMIMMMFGFCWAAAGDAASITAASSDDTTIHILFVVGMILSR